MWNVWKTFYMIRVDYILVYVDFGSSEQSRRDDGDVILIIKFGMILKVIFR